MPDSTQDAERVERWERVVLKISPHLWGSALDDAVRAAITLSDQEAAERVEAGTSPWQPHPTTAPDDADAGTVLASLRVCALTWDGGARLVGNVRAADIVRAVNEVEAALAEARGAVPEGGACSVAGQGFRGRVDPVS